MQAAARDRAATCGRRGLPLALAAVIAATSLAGCAARRPAPDPTVRARDIHEGITIVGNRHGFHSGIHKQRDAGRDIDYTYVRLPLDGVKMRHYSLENMLKGIGHLIAQPEFSRLPIKVEIRASEEADRLFLRDTLTEAIHGKASVDVKLRPAPYSGIVIAVARTEIRAR